MYDEIINVDEGREAEMRAQLGDAAGLLDYPLLAQVFIREEDRPLGPFVQGYQPDTRQKRFSHLPSRMIRKCVEYQLKAVRAEQGLEGEKVMIWGLSKEVQFRALFKAMMIFAYEGVLHEEVEGLHWVDWIQVHDQPTFSYQCYQDFFCALYLQRCIHKQVPPANHSDMITFYDWLLDEPAMRVAVTYVFGLMAMKKTEAELNEFIVHWIARIDTCTDIEGKIDLIIRLAVAIDEGLYFTHVKGEAITEYIIWVLREHVGMVKDKLANGWYGRTQIINRPEVLAGLDMATIACDRELREVLVHAGLEWKDEYDPRGMIERIEAHLADGEVKLAAELYEGGVEERDEERVTHLGGILGEHKRVQKEMRRLVEGNELEWMNIVSAEMQLPLVVLKPIWGMLVMDAEVAKRWLVGWEGKEDKAVREMMAMQLVAVADEEAWMAATDTLIHTPHNSVRTALAAAFIQKKIQNQQVLLTIIAGLKDKKFQTVGMKVLLGYTTVPESVLLHIVSDFGAVDYKRLTLYKKLLIHFRSDMTTSCVVAAIPLFDHNKGIVRNEIVTTLGKCRLHDKCLAPLRKCVKEYPKDHRIRLCAASTLQAYSG